MVLKSPDGGTGGMATRKTWDRARRMPVSVAAGIGLILLLAVGFAGWARAADAVAPQAVSRISVMSLGKITFSDGSSGNFADSIACVSTNGCTGVFGFQFPQFNPLVQVAGGFACIPSDSPTTCAITLAGGTITCTLTVELPAAPGDTNPIGILCSSPSGAGHGLTTLTVLY